MYIWIILATIMIALQFFILPPREDKAYAERDLRAASVVNRFAAHHGAMLRTAGCGRTLYDTSFPEQNPTNIDSNIGTTYTALDYDAYLPIGYDKDNDLDVYHTYVCLDQRANISTVSLTPCSETDFQYVVSYAEIPDKWLNRNDRKQPLPELMRYISSNSHSGATYGWVTCRAANDCILKGDRVAANRQLLAGNYGSHVFFQNFGTKCINHPCFFAYNMVTKGDEDGCKDACCAKDDQNSICKDYCLTKNNN